MHFGWTDLQIFLHVCEAGSMTAAAARCHLTLAAVSARVRGLEESSGVVLLARGARGVTPTPAGEVLASHARLVFAQVQRLEQDLVHAREAPTRPLVILANSAALVRPWVGALAGLRPASILVRESASEVTVRSLQSGAADIGIVSDAVDTRGLLAHDLGPDPLVLAVARGHPWSGRESVPFHEAAQQPWISWGEQGALSTHLLLRAAAAGVQLSPRWTYPAAGGVLDLVGRGMGVTVLPQAVVDGSATAGAIACISLQERWAQRRLLVCHLPGGAPLRLQVAQRIVASATIASAQSA
jgi:DNA-binding transcriptional LysR family regulator